MPTYNNDEVIGTFFDNMPPAQLKSSTGNVWIDDSLLYARGAPIAARLALPAGRTYIIGNPDRYDGVVARWIRDAIKSAQNSSWRIVHSPSALDGFGSTYLSDADRLAVTMESILAQISIQNDRVMADTADKHLHEEVLGRLADDLLYLGKNAPKMTEFVTEFDGPPPVIEAKKKTAVRVPHARKSPRPKPQKKGTKNVKHPKQRRAGKR